MGWGARLLIGLILLIAGAAAATWGLAHYQPAARLLGVVPASPTAKPVAAMSSPAVSPGPNAAAGEEQKIASLESRLARVENATHRAEGSAGRADALVIAFAARRAIDRGVALGYLENLLVSRFGGQHQKAVATIITASRQPIRLDTLVTEYEALGRTFAAAARKTVGGRASGANSASSSRFIAPTARRRAPMRAIAGRFSDWARAR